MVVDHCTMQAFQNKMMVDVFVCMGLVFSASSEKHFHLDSVDTSKILEMAKVISKSFLSIRRTRLRFRQHVPESLA